MDFDIKGVANTLRVLHDKGIHAAGVKEQEFAVFKKGDITYGFAAFAPNIGTVQLTEFDKVRPLIEQLERNSDIVIVSFHGGAEGEDNQHVKDAIEYSYGENRGNVYQFAHHVIDAGADIVFGHGPHVTRAVEVYKNRFIAYSLGNFCTYDRFNLEGALGVAPIIKVNVTPQGRFVKAQITSIKQIDGKGVFYDRQKRALNQIRELTEADGFLHNIRIDPKGFINELSGS
jgi:poly-gamma-glutamate capsule biosynthesis protein CapA/YwtB (metallophosphatase superfamily)